MLGYNIFFGFKWSIMLADLFGRGAGKGVINTGN